jgi:hypothetical protein
MPNTKTRRAAPSIFGLVCGAVLLGIEIARHHPGLGGIYASELWGFSTVACLAGGEWGVLLRGQGDERQRKIQLRADLFAGRMMLTAAIAGFLVEVIRGKPGAFTIMSGIGGGSILIAQLFLKRRM